MYASATTLKKQTDFFESRLRFEIDAFDFFTALIDGERIDSNDLRNIVFLVSP